MAATADMSPSAEAALVDAPAASEVPTASATTTVVTRGSADRGLSHVQAPTSLTRLMNSGIAIGSTAVVGIATGGLVLLVLRMVAGGEPEEDKAETMHIHGVSRRWVNSRLCKSQDMVQTLKRLSKFNDKHKDVPVIIQSITWNVAQLEHLSEKLGNSSQSLRALHKIYKLQTKIQRKLTELVFVVMGTLQTSIISDLHRATAKLSVQVSSFCELCSAVSRVTRNTRGVRLHHRKAPQVGDST